MAKLDPEDRERAARLHRARRARKFSMMGLSRMAEFGSPNHCGIIERGEQRLTYEAAEKFAAVLRVPTDWLYHGTGPDPFGPRLSAVPPRPKSASIPAPAHRDSTDPPPASSEVHTRQASTLRYAHLNEAIELARLLTEPVSENAIAAARAMKLPAGDDAPGPIWWLQQILSFHEAMKHADERHRVRTVVPLPEERPSSGKK